MREANKLLINRVFQLKKKIINKILWETGTLHKIYNLESEINSYKQIFSFSIFSDFPGLMELNKLLKPQKSICEFG